MTRKRRPPTKADAVRVSAIAARNTDRVQAVLNRAVLLATDGERDKRLAERRCRACYYIPKGAIVGHGFTRWGCIYCDHTDEHHNTGVPRCCDACSDELNLCVECGGTLDMTHRQQLRRHLRAKR